MAIVAKVLRTFPINSNRPEAILWEGVLVWEDDSKQDEQGRPILVLKVQCGARKWEDGAFLTMPQRMEAFITDDGKARLRANKWEDRDGKSRYTPLVTLGRGLADMGVKAIQDYLKEEAAPAPGTSDLGGEAPSEGDALGGLSF